MAIAQHRPAVPSPLEVDSSCRSLRFHRWVLWLDSVEIHIVRRHLTVTRPSLDRMAGMVSWLANGWLYVAGGLALFLGAGGGSARALAASGAAAAAAFSVYPLIKRVVARPRPFDRYPDVRCAGTPLDRYAFPSGHCMAAGAVFVPIGVEFPATIPVLAFLTGAIAWARLVLGHHYPTDLAGGWAFGAIVGFVTGLLVL